MKREKNINANVDFYSATVYYTLGIAGGPFHCHFCRQPHFGLDSSHSGTVGKQPSDSAAGRVPGTSVSSTLHSHDRAVDCAEIIECFHHSFNQTPSQECCFSDHVSLVIQWHC